MTTQDATGPRNILILEDEMLIALDIEQMLIELGHKVVAVCTRVPAALVAAGRDQIDFAVLDINVAGVPSFPVAGVSRERQVNQGKRRGWSPALVRAAGLVTQTPARHISAPGPCPIDT